MMADAVLVGAGTLRVEDYGPVRMGEQHRRWRRPPHARGQAGTDRQGVEHEERGGKQRQPGQNGPRDGGKTEEMSSYL